MNRWFYGEHECLYRGLSCYIPITNSSKKSVWPLAKQATIQVTVFHVLGWEMSLNFYIAY